MNYDTYHVHARFWSQQAWSMDQIHPVGLLYEEDLFMYLK